MNTHVPHVLFAQLFGAKSSPERQHKAHGRSPPAHGALASPGQSATTSAIRQLSLQLGDATLVASRGLLLFCLPDLPNCGRNDWGICGDRLDEHVHKRMSYAPNIQYEDEGEKLGFASIALRPCALSQNGNSTDGLPEVTRSMNPRY